MADVKLTVAGRSYDVHCADGEEEHILRLATVVDAKASGIQGGTEGRQLLFAALMLADEVDEAKDRLVDSNPHLDAARAAVALAESQLVEAQAEARGAKEREQAALKQLAETPTDATGASRDPAPAFARALLQIADRIEALASKVAQTS